MTKVLGSDPLGVARLGWSFLLAQRRAASSFTWRCGAVTAAAIVLPYTLITASVY